MEPKKRYTVAVDFDGVLHDWKGDFKGSHVIEGDAIPGAVAWLWNTLQEFDVVIFSCRAATWRGRRAIRNWLRAKGGGLWNEQPGCLGLESVRVTDRKPPALRYIDDRALRFDGRNFPEPREIHNLRPWNRPRAAKTAA